MSFRLKGSSTASWALDAAVAASGTAVGVIALTRLLTGAPTHHWLLALVVAPPVVLLMSRFPLLMHRGRTGIEVGFDCAVLVFLACLDGGGGTLAVWAAGQALAQLTRRHKPHLTRWFNVGIGILAGWVALGVMRAISDLTTTSPSELLAVAVGCAVYFLVDYALSGISVALELRRSIVLELLNRQALGALGVFIAVNSLGYLGAVVVRSLPSWTFILLAVPLVTILFATRAWSRGTAHRRRLTALFEAAAEAQGLQSRAELLDVLIRHGRAIVLDEDVELRARAPQPRREIGAKVHTDDGSIWLVAAVGDRHRKALHADVRALEALASVGEQAFSRLILAEEMRRLARYDGLTGLPNRNLFLSRVEEAAARARRQQTPLAVLFVDLDGFKAVNDRFGHAAGDVLLNTVAKRLQQEVREVDLAARLGGDEFAVLLEPAAGAAEIDVLCSRLLRALEVPISLAGHEVTIGASIGAALSETGKDSDTMLRDADMAMYRAKALGKNRFVLYQPSLGAETARRRELVEALRLGLHNDLVLHYQVVVDLEEGRIAGVEALVRWQRDAKLIHPQSFIRAAEESGLIVQVGRWVLDQVAADAAELAAAAGRPLAIAVNLSPQQLRDASLIADVRRTVGALGRNPLVVEMTEAVLLHNDPPTNAALRALKDAGARLAIDDFGVGVSSIGHLQNLPLDVIKIHPSFTREIATDPRAARLVRAVFAMAAALEVQVVAEGIESRAQAELLRAGGCAGGQGFLFGRPQPLAEMLQSLARSRASAHGARVTECAVAPLPRQRHELLAEATCTAEGTGRPHGPAGWGPLPEGGSSAASEGGPEA
jgi:diguanylate cyclase (GGDEF)-like protein